jgi:hypothetical protein
MDNLAERIARQQAELESLRKELESRQARVAKLNEKKDALEQRLRQLDADIEAVSQGKKPLRRPGKVPRTSSSVIASPAKPVPPKKAPSSADTKPPKRMADLLVDIVSETKGPVTAKPLAAELQKRGFFTASPNLPRVVKARLNDLVREGILRRADGQAGVVLGKVKGEAKTSPGKSAGRKKARKKRGATKASYRVGADGRPRMPLRSIVTELLAKTKHPLMARELGEQAVANGYSTESKDLTNVVQATLGKMDNVVNVPGEGYRLKKQ